MEKGEEKRGKKSLMALKGAEKEKRVCKRRKERGKI